MTFVRNHFLFEELACKCCGVFLENSIACDALERMRLHLAQPVIVNSGYRCGAHNRSVGGSPTSLHLRGRAFDLAVPAASLALWHDAARAAGFTGIGVYRGFIHVDTGPRRMWWG